MNLFSLQRGKRVKAALGHAQPAETDELPPPEAEAIAEEPPCAPMLPDPAELSARLDDLRARFDTARSEPLAAVLILGDAEKVAREIKDGCLRLGQRHAAEALNLLVHSLRQAELLNPAHMDLLLLELEAVRALFRLDERQTAAHADELLATLRRAARRQLSDIDQL